MSKPLFTLRESTRYPGLFVKKYTRKVFYDALWDDELVESRGRVEDKDGNVVIRPFTKIFNRFENNTDIDRDELVIAVRKVNGFMAAATYVPSLNEVIVSTTGSLDSPFVEMAEEYITEKVKRHIKNCYWNKIGSYTYLFEIVHPNDPHIIKESPGAYLIGLRPVDREDPYFSDAAMEINLDLIAADMKVYRPNWYMDRFSSLVEQAALCKHEGYVVYGQESKTSLKIKSPYYLSTKWFARMNEVKLDNILSDPGWKKLVKDEEFYSVVQRIIDDKDVFLKLDEQDRIAFIEGALK